MSNKDRLIIGGALIFLVLALSSLFLYQGNDVSSDFTLSIDPQTGQITGMSFGVPEENITTIDATQAIIENETEITEQTTTEKEKQELIQEILQSIEPEPQEEFGVAANKPISGYVVASDNSTPAHNATVWIWANVGIDNSQCSAYQTLCGIDSQYCDERDYYCYGCNCSALTANGGYTFSNGQYTGDLGNLKYAHNCSGGGKNPGDWCRDDWVGAGNDTVWAIADSSTVVNFGPQGNGSTTPIQITAGGGTQWLVNLTLNAGPDLIPPNITLVAPPNATNETINSTIIFKYNVTDNYGLASCSLYLNGILNQTNTSIANNATNNFTVTLPNGIYNWSVACYDTSSNYNSSETWILYMSLPNQPPQFTIPTNDYSTAASPTNINSNITFTATASDPELDNYQLIICNSSSISQTSICSDTLICNSTFVASGTSASCQHNTSGETQQTYAWYSFVCDYQNCSSYNNTNSPYYLNFHPYSSTVPNQTWAEDNNHTLNLSIYFNDPDNDNLNHTSTSPQNITVNINNQTKIVTFIPDANWFGTRTIIFTAHDPYGLTNISNTIILNITPVNDAPLVTDQVYTNYSGHIFSTTVNASDVDSQINCTLFHSTASSYTPKPMVLVAGTQSSGTWVANLSTSDGYNVFDVINTYAVCNDTLTAVNTSIKNNSIPNYLPTAPGTTIVPSNPTIDADLFCNLTSNSTDPDNDNITYTYNWYKNGINQNISIPTVGSGNTSQGDTWLCTITPYDGYQDGTNGTDSVAIGNSPPVFNTTHPIANITWPEDSTYSSLNLTPHFYDIDGNVLTYNHTPVQNITVIINQTTGMATFIPDANYTGTLTIRFNATDSALWSNYSNYVTLNVSNVNDAPYFDPPLTNMTAYENLTFTYDVNATDIDPTGDTLNFTSNASSNLFIINSTTGLINFTPNSTQIGDYDINFTVCDNHGACQTQTITLSIVNYINQVTFNVTDRLNSLPLNNVTVTGGTTCAAGCTFNHSLTITEPSGLATYTFTKPGFGTNITSINITGDLLLNITLDDNQAPFITYVNITPRLSLTGDTYYIDIAVNVSDNFETANATFTFNMTHDLIANGILNLTKINNYTFTGTLGPYNQTKIFMNSSVFVNDTYGNSDSKTNEGIWFMFASGNVTANATFVLELKPGWNLFSVNSLFNTSLKKHLAPLGNGNWGCGHDDTPPFDCNASDGDFAGNWTIIWTQTNNQTWDYFRPDTYYQYIDNQTLQNLYFTQGYWIYMTAAQNLTIVND